jgi:hypothetical protein
MAKTKELEKHAASTKVNLTIKIGKDVLRKMRILAAERDTSVSGLVADIINEKSAQSGSYEAAMKRAIALMNSGVELNWEKPLSRDELHERR